jgi:phage terminase large subunit-like protein
LNPIVQRVLYNKYIPHTPTEKQAAFLLLDCESAFYGGAASGGKSDALLMAALMYVDQPDYAALLIRDTYKNLSMPGSLMDRANEWLRPFPELHWQEATKTWSFPSGATLTFGYLDGPNDHFNYQGAEFQFVGIDEACNIRENQAKYLFSRLRKLEGSNIPLRFRCASNPPAAEQIAKGQWVKDTYVDPYKKEKEAIFIPARINDNPHVNRESYIKSLMHLDPITRAQLMDGDWEIKVKGRMFDRAWFKIVDAIPQDVTHTVRYWDLAATEKLKKDEDPDWTCGCKMHKTKDGIYYIESLIRFRKSSRYIESIIRQTADLDGKECHVYIEQEPGSSGIHVIDHYRRDILPEFVFNGDKVTGSKRQRAMPLASQAEVGNIYLVNGPWIRDFFRGNRDISRFIA